MTTPREVDTPYGPVRLGTFDEVLALSGRYLNDHCLVHDGRRWHLFGIVGRRRATAEAPISETCFAHASSDDLRRWDVHDDVMHLTGNWPEQTYVCAPYVLEIGGVYHMYYDAIDAEVGAQWVCLATSRDLFAWERYAGNPIVAPSLSWAKWPGYTSEKGVAGSCRDPHVIRLADGRFVMYYTVDLPAQETGQGMVGIAAAVSRDGVHFQDFGPVHRQPHFVTAPTRSGVRSTESCCVVPKDGRYWLFFTNGYWTNFIVSDDPLRFTDLPVKRLGFAHAAEVFCWRDAWWITHCSSDADDYRYLPTNRTRGLFLGKLDWPGGAEPRLL